MVSAKYKQIMVRPKGQPQKGMTVEPSLYELFLAKHDYNEEAAYEEINSYCLKFYKHINSRMVRVYLINAICDPEIKRKQRAKSIKGTQKRAVNQYT